MSVLVFWDPSPRHPSDDDFERQFLSHWSHEWDGLILSFSEKVKESLMPAPFAS